MKFKQNLLTTQTYGAFSDKL